jgi:FAD/FMN-containing dehydrogenase
VSSVLDPPPPGLDPQPSGSTDVPITPEVLGALRDALHGQLVAPGDDGYDAGRLVWNGMIDRHPGAIARCVDADDVMAAVRVAREHGLVLAVRGGGHNVAGAAVCDGGLVIDLSAMKDVEVDAATRTVRAAGGVTIGELDAATQQQGLAVPMGVVTETGIAGLTLSGGLGWLRRRYGLSSDNLVAADVVTSDGRLVHTSATSEPDLLWALRGGGGNFGVVTGFEFQAHAVGPEVAFALLFHAGADAAEALRGFRAWATNAPDDISAFAILGVIPAMEEIPEEHQGRPGLIVAAMHGGTPEVGHPALLPLREIGSPIADLTATTTYLEVQRFFDEDYPAHELRYYWKSRYLAELDDDAIDRLVALNERAPSPHSTLDVWQLGGAMSRVAPEATAFGDRSAPYLLGIEANWEQAADDEANLTWAREVFDATGPYATRAEYLNFPGFYEEGQQAVRDTFGANLDRLMAVKAAYDPTNLFRLNANILPASTT